jgi:hypothetical protein
MGGVSKWDGWARSRLDDSRGVFFEPLSSGLALWVGEGYEMIGEKGGLGLWMEERRGIFGCKLGQEMGEAAGTYLSL